MNLLEKNESDINSDNEEHHNIYDREKYEKLFDAINEIIFNVLASSYSTLFLADKLNENFDFKKILDIVSSNKVVEYAKVFVNLYWQDINDEKTEGTIKSLINDILDLNILKNNKEIFCLIKSTSLFVIITLSRTAFSEVSTYDEFTKKIFNMIRAVLEINKITCLDDEDDLVSDMDNVTNLDNNIFWI